MLSIDWSHYCTSTGCTTIKRQMYFVNFGPCKCNNNSFFDDFMYKTFAQFILHTFWCVLMHIDAFWALTKKSTLFWPKKMKFLKLKSHAQNMLIIHFAHILMHLDASWCILMHSDAFWCILMHFILFKFSKNHFFDEFLHKKFAQFILMHFDASECIKMHQNASKCIRMNCANFWCTNSSKKWFLLNLNRIKCIKMHQNASKCIEMYAELIVLIFCALNFHESACCYNKMG